MALDTGKKVVSLNNNQTQSNYIKPRTSIGTIAKGFEGVMETYTKIAASNQESSWTNDFKQKLFEKKLELKEKHKMDPASMRASTEAYTKALLENVPKVYEGTATALLALNNNNLIEYSTNNKITDDNDKAVAGHINNLNIDNASISDLHNNTVNNEYFNQEGKHNKINQDTANNAYALINENAHNSQVNLVNNNLKNQKIHDQEVVAQIVETEESRLLHMGISFDNENEFFVHMQKFLEGNDSFQNMESKNEAFIIYKKHIKDRDVREDIYKDVLNKYQTWRGDKLKGLVTHNKFNLEAEIEIGKPLHFGQFANGENTNSELYIQKHYPNVSSDKAIIIKKHINKIRIAEDNVAKLKNGEILKGLTEENQEQTFKQLLFQHGISVNPNEILDVKNPNFQVVKEIFQRNGSIPKEWEAYINQEIGDPSRPEVMKGLKKQLEFYNQIKGEFAGFHTNVDTSSFMYFASTENLLELDDEEIIQRALSWNKKNKKAINASIDLQVSQNPKEFTDSIDVALDGNKNLLKELFMPFRDSVSRSLSASTIFGGGNKYSKVLFEDSWTLFADGPMDLMSDGVKADFLKSVQDELKFMATSPSVDITDQKVISKATFSALNKLLKTNYTPSKFVKKGMTEDMHGYKLTKHGIENEFNLSDTALIYSALPTMDAWYASKSKEEISSGLFGQNENGKNISYEDIIARMKDGDIIPVFEPTGKMVNGKMSYSVSINNGDGRYTKITEPGENFQPGEWENVNLPEAASNKAEALKNLADENVSFIEELLGDFDTTESTTKYLIRKFADGGEKGLINLANWSWMMDVPIVDDVPKEVKPFKMLFNLLGKDVPDLDERLSKIAIHNKKQADKQTYSKEIDNNKRINNKSKALESIYPPHKQTHTSYKNGMMFSHYALKNYNNTTLPLTHRTNNLMGITKSKNDNSLDVTAENNTAVFAHPKDSIKSSIAKMISMSSIVPGNNKIFGDTPTIEKLLSEFNPKDKNLYLNALTKSKLIAEDIVNFQDENQLASIIKFMIKAKMNGTTQPGTQSTFDMYYPKGNLMIDIYINEGVKEAFNMFAGKFGKI
jgi:hypothetical protein